MDQLLVVATTQQGDLSWGEDMEILLRTAQRILSIPCPLRLHLYPLQQRAHRAPLD
ncbi:hypothetical protein BofuT4_P004990.1 [Botrytis cinerea T4]|uniref:Uncharacterized protein n=1 Tax=Botryotinia fuckeliana (strain T4) TaxID=999810 RepID=G2Y3V0_BOTF4|nr:hypothetical protein BofuT4_P004990.1 [Botrytis cinerea T4]